MKMSMRKISSALTLNTTTRAMVTSVNAIAVHETLHLGDNHAVQQGELFIKKRQN
jgi:hypothetical protein